MTTAQVGIASVEERAVAEKFIHLAYGSLRVKDKRFTSDEVERVMRLLDEGQLDGVIERFAPVELPSQTEMFADLKPFSHDAWKQRHGVTD